MNYLRRFYNYYVNDTKIVNKFLYIIVAILLVSVFVLNFYVRESAETLITEEVKNNTRQYLEQYVDNIGYRLSKFNTMLNSISTNQTVRTMLDKDELSGDDIARVEQEIRNILRHQFPYGLYDISVCPIGSAMSAEGSFVRNLSDLNEGVAARVEASDFNRYFVSQEGRYKINLLTVLRPIYSPDGNSTTAIIKLSLFPEKVFKTIEAVEHNSSSSPFIIDNDANFIHGRMAEDIPLYLEFLKSSYPQLYSGVSIADYQSDIGNYMASISSANGFRAVYRFSLDDAAESISRLNKMVTAYILILIALTVVSAWYLSFGIGKRMRIVLEKMHRISQGDLTAQEEFAGNDEIGVIDRTVTDMVARLSKLIEDNYISEMTKKDAQFMALQSQINPHFLFNSLESINALIETEEYDIAVLVNTKLSDLLRYCINYNSAGIVKVREELEYMYNYVYIQKVRFGNKFSFHSNVEPECLEYDMIKLIFQPFIENSINHGLAGRLNGNIWFNMRLSADREYIDAQILDDGKGMSQERLAELNRQLIEKPTFDFVEKNSSIGMHNINQRMKLKYGEDCRINLSSNAEGGLCVSLKIPVNIS